MIIKKRNKHITRCNSWRQKCDQEAEKILKYKDLIIEIQCMWNVKAKVILVIIGTTGTISKSLRQYLSNIPRKHKIKELQKTAILGTVHILWGEVM
jgi:RNase P/RNase MRP subunit POP5